MTTTTLILIRHGETEANYQRVYQGHSGVGLNARGQDQARRVAARLAQTNVHIDHLYASDLERAVETAEIIGVQIGLSVVHDVGLREVYLGAWEGLSRAEVAERYPEEYAAWWRGEDIRRGGGESYSDLQRRLAATLDALAHTHGATTLCVVTHGAAIKQFIAYVLGISVERQANFHGVANTSISVVQRVDEGPWLLRLWNDTRHLPDDPLVDALQPDA